MKNNYKLMTRFSVALMCSMMVFANCINAQVSTYTFAQMAGVSSPISGGTAVATATGFTGVAGLDDNAYTGQAIPFTFTFNGVPYTSFSVTTNGFITFGATAPAGTNYTPISNVATYTGAVAAIGRDIRGVYATGATRTLGSNILTAVVDVGQVFPGDLVSMVGVPVGTIVTAVGAGTITMSAAATTTGTSTVTFATGQIRTETIGVTPNQIHVIQFTRFQAYNTLNTSYNFQIRLYETSNVVEVVYGPFISGAAGGTPQVGLRGATNADFNNRTTTTDWSATTAGAINTATETLSATVFPASGQTYVWTPPPLVYDMGVSALATPAAIGCFGATESVSVTLRNYGTGSIDMSVNPVSVSGAVTGPNPAAFGPIVINSGIIAAGGTQTVVLSASYNMSAAGTYVFNSTMTVAGDATSGNDAMAAVSLVKTSPSVLASSDVAFCAGGSTTITAVPSPNTPPVTGTNATTFAIPDNNPVGVNSVINLNGVLGASSVTSVSLSITHTFDADLDITLIAPNGSQIDLSSDNGAGGDNYTNTVFVPTGFPSITTGVAPMTGSFTPEQAFSTLTGSGNGNWTLKVVDDLGADVGSIISWSITIPSVSGNATYAWSPALGLSSTTIANPVATPAATTTYTVLVTDNSGCTATDNVMVTVNALPTASASSTPVLCNGGTSSVTIVASGGTPAYTGEGTFTQSAGTTVYTVTDANSCAGTTSVVVTEPTAVAVTPTSSAILCNGGTSTVTISATGGTPGYTGTGSFTQSAGTTIYTVTDANSCTGTASVVVTQPTAVVVTPTSSAILCNGGTSSVTIVASGGTPTYTGEGTFTQSAGTTVYTVTDANSCTGTASVVVTEPTLLVASNSSTAILCNGGTATVTVSATGGTTAYTGTGTFTQSAGMTTYTVTDANGCSTTTNATLTEPTAIVLSSSETGVLCNGGTSSVTIGATGGTPAYSGVGTFPQSAGTIMYTVTDGNACTATINVTVVEPTALVATSSSTAILCNGGTSTVTVSSTGGTIPYSGDGTFTQSAGTTVYTVTDANGCIATASETITEPTAVMVMSSFTPILCNGGTSTVTISAMDGTPAYAGEGTFTQSAGTTVYTVTDANSCIGTASVVITEPTAIATSQTINLCASQSVTVGTSTYTTAGTYTDIIAAFNTCDSTVTTTVTTTVIDVTTSTAGADITSNSSTGTYQWLDCNTAFAPITGETNQTYSSIANGDYAVEITDNGCVDTSACVNISTTGIANNSENDLSVYPNPTNGTFNVVISNANISELGINIVDIQGKEIFSSIDKNVNGVFNKQINLEELSKGVYYIKVTTGAEVKIQKLIVQ